MTTFSPPATPKSGPQTSPPGSPRGSVSGAAARVVCAGLTPTTPLALTAYRSRHVIKVVRDWGDDFRTYTEVCERDGIRVSMTRDGRRRHDPSEIKQLAAFERGEKVDWTIP